MSTFHQMKWRSCTLSFWYAFPPNLVVVFQVITWLHHVICRNGRVSFWYVLPPLLVIDAGLQAQNFIKNRLQRRCFPENITKFLRTHIVNNICKRLLLKKIQKLWPGSVPQKHWLSQSNELIEDYYKYDTTVCSDS